MPHRLDTDDLVPVRHVGAGLARGPLEVVVELHPQREQVLVVDEVDQPVPGLQVAQEAELAGGVAHRHEVLEEGHLHGRVVDQHPAVPPEAGLAFEEPRRAAVGRGGAGVVLGQCDREREVRRAESDADDVVDHLEPPWLGHTPLLRDW